MTMISPVLASAPAEGGEMSSGTIASSFIFVLLAGLVAGILGARVLLPKLGDAVSSFLFSMGSRTTAQDTFSSDSPKAVALMAAGNYEGALAEYERLLKQTPDDLQTIAKIARIHAEFLEDPITGLSFLRDQLSSRSWPPDAEAFLLFRIAGIHREAQHDRPAAREVLGQVMARFPNTRHSANARQKLKEWQDADAREEASERRKAAQRSVQ
ncbi:MAG: hypothetical protein JWO94_1239 [Verrucomicrobiaceae bacterium]|nr:hypothetical protein [Verrucomicrobiaceae bacterium]